MNAETGGHDELKQVVTMERNAHLAHEACEDRVSFVPVAIAVALRFVVRPASSPSSTASAA
jgi:hypothetical protein